MTQKELQTIFTRLIADNNRIIHKICHIYERNNENRKDLYQEIIGNAWQAFSKFRGDSKFSTWLYQVSINTAITRFKKEKRVSIQYDPEILLSEPYPPEPENDDKTYAARLYQAIEQLNEIEKAIITLYLDDTNYDEMEIILGISNNTLRVKMTRIKEKLRNIIK